MKDPLDLRELERGSAPNQFLACPPRFCRAEPDMTSPRFLVAVEQLAETVKRELSRQPRTETVAESPALQQVVFVQRSAIFRFPDTIWVQFVALDAESASLAIYSRSTYGYGDFGVNARRVRDWLAAIEEAVGEARVAAF